MNISAHISHLLSSLHGSGKRVPLAAESGEPLQLKEGESIKAEVANARQDGKLAFRTSGGQHFLAEVLSDRTFIPGQRVTLTVMEMRGDTPMVEITGESGSSPLTFLKAMKAPPTGQNIALAQEALTQMAEFSPKQFAALSQTLSAFPELSAEQAVFMARHNIPINKNTIAQYKALAQPETHLGNLLQKLLNILPAQSGGEAQQAAPSPAAQTSPQAQQAAQQQAPPQQAQVQPQAPAATQAPAQVIQFPAQPTAQIPLDQPAIQAPAQATSQTPAQPAQTTAQAPAQPAIPSAPAQSIQIQVPIPQAPITQAAPQTPAQPATQMPAQAIMQAPIQTQAQPITPQAPPAQPTAQAPLQAPAQPAQTTQAPAQPTIQPTIQPATQPAVQTATPTLTVASMPTTPASTPAPAPPPSSPVAASPPPVAAQPQAAPAPAPAPIPFDPVFTRIAPERGGHEVSRELEVPKVAREIGRVIADALDAAKALPEQARQEVLSTVREIVQTLRFADQLSHCATFAQLPLSLNGEKTTAHLYVFNDSSEKKKIDPQNATAFLSLSTANIGTVEGFVKVIGKGVEADFALETEDSVGLFRQGITELSNLIEAQGYRLERLGVSVAKLEEMLSPAAIEKGHAEILGRYKFNRAV